MTFLGFGIFFMVLQSIEREKKKKVGSFEFSLGSSHGETVGEGWDTPLGKGIPFFFLLPPPY